MPPVACSPGRDVKDLKPPAGLTTLSASPSSTSVMPALFLAALVCRRSVRHLTSGAVTRRWLRLDLSECVRSVAVSLAILTETPCFRLPTGEPTLATGPLSSPRLGCPL